MADEKILIDLGNVRIRKYDKLNVVIEVLEEVSATYKNPFTGETLQRDPWQWDERGYYGDTKAALRAIYRHDLLLPDQQRSLAEYISDNKKILKKLQDFGL